VNCSLDGRKRLGEERIGNGGEDEKRGGKESRRVK